MAFIDKASKVFPDAKWTGGGNIHASIARQGAAPLPFGNPRLVMKSLLETHFPSVIQRVILKNCPGMEWLMSNDDFESLLLVDYYRLLHGNSTMETKYRLKNPHTGNLFHRISLVPEHDMVGGIRVWIFPMTEEDLQIGFRFRLETLKGESEYTSARKKAQQQALEVNDEMVIIKEFAEQETAAAIEIEEAVAFE